jgi:hypothetical protein
MHIPTFVKAFFEFLLMIFLSKSCLFFPENYDARWLHFLRERHKIKPPQASFFVRRGWGG